MIHPTRTNLLMLKGKTASVAGSIAILKARRQALIREFLTAIAPFLDSRDAIRRDYRLGLTELHLSQGHEGREVIESLAAIGEREIGVDIQQKNVMGVRYRDLTVHGELVRTPEERSYDFAATTAHLEESYFLFERIVEAMLEVATFESKLKKLGEEIQKVTRRSRVLEERVLPKLNRQIRSIAQYIGEREREAYFRLKRFKDRREQ
ncbi:V-type ATP synthase subunit D [Desulfuromonas versatilis]|uniref:V-type ATP synthase subunit D n=1 Tax=Desulfuromonas versatilis TaxID=2802975 RepID=A0ABM8HW24_9BACT|nr:V-type ATP synthase subunit D [Desulfuromonas versatilis]BCR04725.1 V-type ATP synthase subunit D [Desulfuromonas versatilis]